MKFINSILSSYEYPPKLRSSCIHIISIFKISYFSIASEHFSQAFSYCSCVILGFAFESFFYTFFHTWSTISYWFLNASLTLNSTTYYNPSNCLFIYINWCIIFFIYGIIIVQFVFNLLKTFSFIWRLAFFKAFYTMKSMGYLLELKFYSITNLLEFNVKSFSFL